MHRWMAYPILLAGLVLGYFAGGVLAFRVIPQGPSMASSANDDQKLVYYSARASEGAQRVYYRLGGALAGVVVAGTVVLVLQRRRPANSPV